MGKKSRDKGKRGELEIAHLVERLGMGKAVRGGHFQGQPGGAGLVPDVVVEDYPDLHLEVKRGENMPGWRAITQAKADAGTSKNYVVAFRRNNDDWHGIVDLVWLLQLIKKAGGTTNGW